MKFNSMDENDFATRQSSQAVESKRYTFALILCFVMATSMNILIQWKPGRKRLSGHQHRELDRMDGAPVEFEWTLSLDTQHCSYFMKFKERWKSITFCLITSKIEASTSMGQKMKQTNVYFESCRS